VDGLLDPTNGLDIGVEAVVMVTWQKEIEHSRSWRTFTSIATVETCEPAILDLLVKNRQLEFQMIRRFAMRKP